MPGNMNFHGFRSRSQIRVLDRTNTGVQRLRGWTYGVLCVCVLGSGVSMVCVSYCSEWRSLWNHPEYTAGEGKICFVLVCSDRAWEVLGDLKAGLGRGPRGWEVRAWKNESTGSRRDKPVVRPCVTW